LSGGHETSREYPVRPLFGVGALIIDRERIILVKRGKQPAKGEWSIPGGLVETGEPIKTAVMREVLEETGLEVEPQSLVELVERIFPDGTGKIRYHYVIADYLCRVVGGSLNAGSDAREAVWVARSDLHRYSLAPVTSDVITKAFVESERLGRWE
jgi:ADP-ribose pyrophosphatase YjhB (NUDIX family)